MCKLLIIMGLGILLNGCATAQKSQQVSTVHQSIQEASKIRRGDGCRMLHNGYLVCAKVPR